MVDAEDITEWRSTHPRWAELEQFFDTHKDTMQEVIRGYDQRDSRVLVASLRSQIVGILRFIVIPIGPDVGLPAVELADEDLLQAKVMNFFVLPGFRRKGIWTKAPGGGYCPGNVFTLLSTGVF